MRDQSKGWLTGFRSVGWLIVGMAVGPELALAAESPQTFPSPVSAEESLRHFRLDPELKVELVAAEPEVVDPVAVQFGADGSLWVVEMRDYPHGPGAGETPQSRIVHLFDRDQDGRFETSEVFADHLLFCTGVLPYRDGLIVTMAGQIAFLADRDGDGRAEFRETWFSGFAQENSQLRANHPTYGPDGSVYVANGLRGGKIVAEKPEWKRTATPLVITGFDFRFHPETGDFSTVTGHGQFGLTFDDLGRRFVCSNRNPCQHVVLENWYLQRNPRLAVKAVMHDVCAPAERSRLFPISQAWTTSTLHANQFTAACGVLIYRGDALPAEYTGNVFTCDPTGNLVHREIVQAEGATFHGRSPYADREFLASPDTWFRPVNLAHGPDGALYIVDMYRAVIEHPDFMPSELKTRPDLRWGDDRGRIYRVVSKVQRPAAATLPAQSSLAERVEQLASRNAWQAETALRLLVEERAAETADLLRARFLSSSAAPPEDAAADSAVGTCRALWALQQLGALDRDDLLRALEREAWAETACRLAESLLAEDAALRAKVASWVGTTNPRITFQALLSLTGLTLEAGELSRMAQAVWQWPEDPWLRTAALLAVGQQTAAWLHEVARQVADQPHPARASELMETLTELAVTHEPLAAVVPSLELLARLDHPEALELWLSVRRGWGVGMARRGAQGKQELAALPDGGQTVQTTLQHWLQEAARVAQDPQVAVELRQSALRTLRWAEADLALPVLTAMLSPNLPTELTLTACDTLAAFPHDSTADALLRSFPQAVPAVRRTILETLLSHPQLTQRLLDAVERAVNSSHAQPEGAAETSDLPAIRPAEIDPQRSQRLQNHSRAEIRERAQRLLNAGSGDRAAVLEQYAAAAQSLGDAQRGKVLFQKHCTACHRIGNMGVNVGPDIGDTRDKTPQYLLTAILDPNRAVDNNYFGYAVATQDGKVRTGILAAVTPTSITLKQAEGKTETILREEIEDLRATGQSFMPVGFEKNLSVAEMADLVSFLKNWRYLDGAVPLGGR